MTSQESSSSIDCRHFDFDLGGKKIPSASLFYRLIRYRRFNGNQVSQESLQSLLSFFHLGKHFSSDTDDSSDRDDYLETGLYKTVEEPVQKDL